MGELQGLPPPKNICLHQGITLSPPLFISWIISMPLLCPFLPFCASQECMSMISFGCTGRPRGLLLRLKTPKNSPRCISLCIFYLKTPKTSPDESASASLLHLLLLWMKTPQRIKPASFAGAGGPFLSLDLHPCIRKVPTNNFIQEKTIIAWLYPFRTLWCPKLSFISTSHNWILFPGKKIK